MKLVGLKEESHSQSGETSCDSPFRMILSIRPVQALLEGSGEKRIRNLGVFIPLCHGPLTSSVLALGFLLLSEEQGRTFTVHGHLANIPGSTF